MGISDSIQTLSAAFSFGILLQAASAALFIHYKGHGSTLFQDGRRLVLVLFLLFGALWAQVEFLNLLLPSLATTPCQVTLIFSTVFDQLARVAMEQFLLWSVGYGKKVTSGRLLLQGVLLIRLIAGAVLVGFTRPDFAPTCVARTSVLPISIVVLALDGIIISTLMIRALSLGMLRDMSDKGGNRQDESKALVFSILGLTVWFAMSIPMVLGIPSILLILRTVLPANGIFILIGIVTIFSGNLMTTNEEITTPEARSPFVTPMGPSREALRNDVGNGSPISGHTYTKSGALFVVNPSSTPRDSPTTLFQGSRGDTRGFTKLGDESTISVRSLGKDGTDRVETKNGSGYRGSSGIFPSPLSQGNLVKILPQVKNDAGFTSTVTVAAVPVAAAAAQKRGLFNFSKAPPPKPSVRSLGISQPLVSNTEESNIQPFARMATIDLAQAAANERERREGAVARSRLVANRPAPQPPTISAKEALGKSISVKRKEMPSRVTQQVSEVPASGNTASASLSPSREEVRRRSPRNVNNFNLNSNEKELNPTPLQRNPTLGLPSNPRAKRVTMARPGKTQTVMFMNNVVYDNPGIVNSIIQEAPKMYAAAQEAKAIEKSHWSPTTTLRSSNSVIHRPRPIRRNTQKDILGHRRSKSGSSIGTGKNIFMSAPGSPTNLPPLPPPPTSAANLKRLLQADTKSMTFNEKIEFLFPAPPERQSIHRRRSSVPSLSRVPSEFLVESPSQTPTEAEQDRRISKRTTIASVALLEINKAAPFPKQESNEQTYRFSANTYRNIAEVDPTLVPSLPEVPTRQASAQGSLLAVPKRRSVYDELQKLKNSVQDKPYIPDERIDQDISISEGPMLRIEAEGHQITVKMDAEETHESFVSIPDGNEISFFLDADQPYPGNKSLERVWHRRIGDELPTFSGRKSASAARKMPPPTPLLLNRRGRGRTATIVVRNTEPSPPADSPGRAIEEIQAQLKRFEEPGRNSVSSLLKRLPNADSLSDAGGSRLLANLEKEMGLQEDHWQQNKANMDRDSMSSISSSRQDIAPRPEISRESSQRSIRTAPKPLSRRARIRTSIVGQSKSPEGSSNRSTSTSSSTTDNSRASAWQQRLAEAQMEYTENAPTLLRSHGLNFLAVSKAHVGSPTPPDTESGTDFESDSDHEMTRGRSIAPIARKEIAALWKAPILSPTAAFGRLWNPPHESMAPKIKSPEPPAKNIRPVQRRSEHVLPIFSFNLWSKPHTSKKNAVVGLWGSKSIRPRSNVTRRASGKPTRRSRRITFLPDILESPVPLPDKKALGIFQFPWGETSDQPIYPPAFNPIIPTAPIINARLDSRSRQLEPENSDYSSFFDDYDDDDQDIMDPDSDDDFDETTLWEIASLLQSQDVPSKLSLLPPARANSIEDYDGSEIKNTRTEFAPSTDAKLPIQPLTFSNKENSKLWSRDAVLTTKIGLGLPQPAPMVWDALVSQSEVGVETKHRPARPLSLLGSSDLWMPSMIYPAEVVNHGLWVNSGLNSSISNTAAMYMWTPQTNYLDYRRSGMFTLPKTGTLIRTTEKAPVAFQNLKAPRQPTLEAPTISSRNLWVPSNTMEERTHWLSTSRSAFCSGDKMNQTTSLWMPSAKVEAVLTTGLFSLSAASSSLRSSNLAPAAITMINKPRSSRASLSKLTSSKLWDGCTKLPVERDWVSESSIRPESPSAYSMSSSGASSPISDSSSIKSTSTKASSIWGSASSSVRSLMPSWWESKGTKKTPAISPIDDQAHPSKIPVRQKSLKGAPLPSVRESRVLASRDLWEAKAPALEPPTKRSRSKTVSQQPSPPIEKSLRHQYRPTLAFHGNWDEALAEAIAAGTKRLTRPISTKADWESALAKAISLSKPRMVRPRCTQMMWAAALNEALSKSIGQRDYDVAVLHPVFFTTSLISSTNNVHPAAIGHVTRKYDPSVLHPVFFTESLTSIGSEIHPAAIGHVVEEYNPSILHPVFFTKSRTITSGDIHPVAIGHFGKNTDKVAMWASTLGPVLSMSGNVETTAMWTARLPSPLTSADLFKHDKSRSTKKLPLVRAVVEQLESSELFKNTAEAQEIPHWLHETSLKPVLTNGTWVGLSKPISNTETTGMWKLKTLPSQIERSLFQNPHSEPWLRSKRSETPLAVIESDMWRPSRDLPQSPKNWLLKKPVSRVQFRY